MLNRIIWQYLKPFVHKQMSSHSFKDSYLQTICLQIIYIICKQDFVLNDQQGLICHETQPNQTKPS